MDEYVFRAARRLLTDIYGALYEMESGHGFRCVKAERGQIFLYRPVAGLADGNLGEIAFEIESHARRAERGIVETRHFFKQLKVDTGHATERDSRYDWPRIGFSEKAEVELIGLRLKAFLGMRS
ncbi:hypothetical protein [Pseudomonas oryzihabitans]|uniref:hypothetical protein n=1 Tax=Pseudomonas oryzihabitans TaxID=47885 RepID=UPI000EC539E4|nr:hypothetical protein [Pseudomonas oryzihabitans]HCV76861.1 hypothetical protein [Pseudomonas sp.]